MPLVVRGEEAILTGGRVALCVPSAVAWKPVEVRGESRKHEDHLGVPWECPHDSRLDASPQSGHLSRWDRKPK